MNYMATADTDIGTRREANQDSLLIRHAETAGGEVLLCVICDGMGGLSRGELASATVIRTFSDWFDRTYGAERIPPDMEQIAKRWKAILEGLNQGLCAYGERKSIRLGTTFSGILFAGGKCLICHVGDSRIYHIHGRARQLTKDQTLAAQNLRAGSLSANRAGSGRNVLLQCVGASASVTPQLIIRRAGPGTYMLCSDGLCHEMTAGEMREALRPGTLTDHRAMHRAARRLIDLAKSRGETDNISALLVRAKGGRKMSAGKRRG